jgi:glutamine synthetase
MLRNNKPTKRHFKTMSKQHFLFLGHQDFSGIMRGRSVPKQRREDALSGGLPWVPANYSIGPTNILPGDNPFGPMGEIRLFPDPSALATLPAYGERPAFDLVLCDGRMPDGSPWLYCPRTALKSVIVRLQKEAGLTMKVAFEHEFLVKGLNQQSHPAFSLSSGRNVSHLADLVMETLGNSGIELEQFVAEYGTDQFEISSVPTDPLTAADRVVLTLETIRDCARQLGLHTSFLPKPLLSAAGNGVHIHFSLYRDGKPVTATNDWVTQTSGAFTQGIIDHAESAVAFTCLSTNSYLRLRPHSWVGAYTCVGVKNREAMIRLVPRTADAQGNNPNASLEYRVTDATANVYVALAAIIGAGLDGLMTKKAPTNVSQDPDGIAPAERETMGIRLLPQSMETALKGIDVAAANRWLGSDLVTAYLACRREDLRQFGGGDPEQAAQTLMGVY